ncbi:MAG: valine--tRNA ligase, partial [Candidatus Omnitrophica bacterium]|nr:valine--tRNA ligase [Candidatus Omnitrophota bacterium]
VAVNPNDRRYKKDVGKILLLPLMNREIKIIADPAVDKKFGTAAVKVTPAHDPNDYLLGKKHNLEFINVMYPDGRMNQNAGDYKDMDRFEAREVILEDLKERGLLEKIEPHRLSAGHCYRCHTIIEPYLSKQWFVKMKPLAAPAIEAVKKGKIKFYPGRWTKVYLHWMESIQDWCISRQIWWGHRIPVYYCRRCQEKKGIIVSRVKPDKCPACGSTDIYQDEDVLDTWFSSWLWPFATFYWPPEAQNPEPKTQSEADLRYFYPTSVLVTAQEIIFFWVARMIMAGLEFMHEIPFRDVYIHGTVRDIEGKKMSKSLGNIIDPLQIIDEYGADALRFSLISITAQGQDVFLSKERFAQGRNFANKIWNASRFIITNLENKNEQADLCVFFKNEKLGTINRWILSRFYSALKKVTLALDSYRFNDALNTLYGFFWHEFCDWYLEIIKHDIKNPHHQLVMYKVLEKTLRLLHPFMPFITEEIWHRVAPASGPVMVSSWPHMQAQMIDKRSEEEAAVIFETVKTIRNLRCEIEIAPERKVCVSIYPHAKNTAQLISDNLGIITHLSKLEKLDILRENRRMQSAISDIIKDADIYLHFSGLVDIGGEKVKIKERLVSESGRLSSKKKLILQPEFIKKARPEVVQNIRNEIEELKNKIRRMERLYDELR